MKKYLIVFFLISGQLSLKAQGLEFGAFLYSNNHRVENSTMFSSFAANNSMDYSFYFQLHLFKYRDTLMHIGLATEYYSSQRIGEVDYLAVPIRTIANYTSFPIYISIEYPIVKGSKDKIIVGHQFGYYFSRVDFQIYTTANNYVLPTIYQGYFEKGDYVNHGINVKLINIAYIHHQNNLRKGKFLLGFGFGRDINTIERNNPHNLFIPRFWHSSIYMGTTYHFNLKRKK